MPRNNLLRRVTFPFAEKNMSAGRRRLLYEPLESRLTLDGTGFAGNACPPDLDLSGIQVQSVQAGEELVIDLLAEGGSVTDVDSDGNPTGDTIRLLLDPDDTPEGASISPGGVFRWTPALAQTGTFEIVVLAVDSGDPPLADAEVFQIEVNPNTAPDLADIDDQDVAVNGMLEVMVTASDADGDNLVFALDRDDPDSTVPDDAELEQLDNTTAIIRWTPDAADAGQTFVFPVIVVDDGDPPQPDREVFNVNVLSVAAVDDEYQTAVDEALTIDIALGVLANDTDSDGDSLTAFAVDDTNSGDLTVESDGSFTYVPIPGFRGTDSFTYRAEDGNGHFSQATVTILVNDDPVAVDDMYNVDEDTMLNVDAASGVLDNDHDADGDALTATLVNDVTNGTLTLNADGSFTYEPNANFNGTDSFTYRISDGISESAEATVTIDVTGVNDAPTTVADTYAVDEDMMLDVNAEEGVLDNDSDVEGDNLTATIVDTPSNGDVTLNSDGSFTYTPDANFEGSDEFTYVANDGTDDSQTTTVSITVNPINDEPVAADEEYAATEDTTLVVNVANGVLANDSDADGDDLTATLVDDVEDGTLTLNADGSFTYEPATDFSGIDSFRYMATDGTATSDLATVTITVADQNALGVAENSPAGTVVGQVVPEGDLGATVVFSFDDPNLNTALELAADDHISGNPAGSVVLIEYLDFQCPACQAYHPIVGQLEANFPNDLTVITRHLPLSEHQNAFAAAVAAEAAGRQNAFDAFGDMLFDHQDDWEFQADPQPFFETYAGNLGLDVAQFQADQNDPALTERVQRDLDAVTSIGGTGTPTFYLDGQQIPNPASQNEFTSLIQAKVNAVDDVFALDRLTGQITVRDGAELDFEMNSSFTLMVNAIGLDMSETINVTIDVTDIAQE